MEGETSETNLQKGKTEKEKKKQKRQEKNKETENKTKKREKKSCEQGKKKRKTTNSPTPFLLPRIYLLPCCRTISIWVHDHDVQEHRQTAFL